MQDADRKRVVRVTVREKDDDDNDGGGGGDDDDKNSEEAQRHVGFLVEGGDDGNKPNVRLHRRDTPHHLKNKRINATVDKDKVASIIAQVR